MARQKEEKNTLKKLLDELSHRPNFDLRKARQRADDLTNHSIGVADAAHLSFAEQAEADLVTVDDRTTVRESNSALRYKFLLFRSHPKYSV